MLFFVRRKCLPRLHQSAQRYLRQMKRVAESCMRLQVMIVIPQIQKRPSVVCGIADEKEIVRWAQDSVKK